MVGIVPVLENWRDPNSLTAQSLDVGQLAGQSHKVATVPGPKKNLSKHSFSIVFQNISDFSTTTAQGNPQGLSHAPVSHVADIKAFCKQFIVARVPISESIRNQLVDGQRAPVLF